MLTWLAENVGTIIVVSVLAVIVAGVIVMMVRDRKKGRSTCGCGCSSCPMSASCGKSKKD